MKKALEPRDWGLQSDAEGRLMVGPFRAVELAREFGTPLHVLNVPRLERAARDFIDSVRSAYPGPSSVHYAFKCNALPAVVEAVRRAGLGAEVMSEFELDLAFRLGYRGRDIVVNGPGKPAGFLKKCLAGGARLINLDSLDELTLLQDLARAERRTADVLVRVNPNVVPRRTNAGSATGSRRGCAFGLDLEGGEVRIALSALKKADRLRFRGFSFHIGTGIRDPQEYARAVRRLRPLIRESRAEGFRVEILDVGGGFAAPTTRELATREFLLYQGLGRLPSSRLAEPRALIADFGAAVADEVGKAFVPDERPELIFEPGRSIASPNQLLLLTVQEVKSRPGVRTWLITDGGLGTVSLPTFYEYHEVLLADDVARPVSGRVTIVGRVCFAADIVYRNKPLPVVKPGEVLAIMDSGAYFLALESSFGFPRPAVAAVDEAGVRLVRRRESFEDMVGRDILPGDDFSREVDHEIRGH